MRPSLLAKCVVFCTLTIIAVSSQAEVMLQWFETEWDEMYRRMPVAAEVGYDYIWTPPPTKAPTGLGTKWGNVGYSLYDRFDLGDVPQRGSWVTRYGSRGSLRSMVNAAHGLDVKIIPDIVMNHNGNGPDIRYYPGMKPEDFHLQWSPGYVNTLNYQRAPRMTCWDVGGGYGCTMWQDLASLIDIRTEPDDRFTGGANTPGWNFVAGANFIRHVGQYDRYPYTYTNETAREMLYRWVTWLGNAMDYDGLRLDAGKHTPWEFFGSYDDQRFLHQAQWNFGQRQGFSNSGYPGEVFQNYIVRKDALIFAEILSYWDELKYWYGYSGGNDRCPMRFLDYQMKKNADQSFNGDLSKCGIFGADFGANNGILYVYGHDEDGPGKKRLAYAYILTHVGFPMVYFTGNNLSWSDSGRGPSYKTWMIPGFDSYALGASSPDVANMVWVHQQFARASERKVWDNDGDFFALERYDDKDSNGADAGDGILIAALNDSGGDMTKTVNTLFDPGTVLKDYSVFGRGEVTVDASRNITINVPGNGGEGWSFYAPKIADPVRASVK
ncbi:MAG: alpha-amylase family glycosyl hydrolase, partial [Lentisphaerota bacterium]